MENKFKSIFKPYLKEIFMNKLPIIIGILLIYGYFVWKNSGDLSRDGTIGFTIVMVI